jgi:hypothetical protein
MKKQFDIEDMVQTSESDFCNAAYLADGSPKNRNSTFYTITYFHRVRDCLENQNFPSAHALFERFLQLRTIAHSDAESALRSGLVIALTEKEGNYTHTPYIYQGEQADFMRSCRWNIDKMETHHKHLQTT